MGEGLRRNGHLPVKTEIAVELREARVDGLLVSLPMRMAMCLAAVTPCLALETTTRRV